MLIKYYRKEKGQEEDKMYEKMLHKGEKITSKIGVKFFFLGGGEGGWPCKSAL